MIEERTYNDKGQVIKTSKYNLSDPSGKYISQIKLDEKGKEIGTIDEFGDNDCEYEYLENTGIVSSVKDRNGHKTSYGYNPMTEELVSMSASVENEENTNIYGYTLGFLTSLSHNDFSYEFEYDGFGRQTAVRIEDQDKAYMTTQYLDNSVLNSFASGEVVETIKDTKGNVTKVNYTAKDSEQPLELVKNTYDENDNLIKQEECIEIKTTDQTAIEKNVYENQYDSHGNVIYSSKSKVIDEENVSKEIEISSDYNEFDNVESSKIKIENPREDAVADILTYNYKYDNSPDNRLQSLTLPNGSTQALEYDLLDRVKDIYYDDKFSKHINYVKKGEYCSDLVSSIWYGKNGVIEDNTKYQYDEKGNITKIFENGTEKVRYTYDNLSRLIREDNKELNQTYIFSYDNGGNIFEKFETVYTLANAENIVKETVTAEDISNDKQEYGFSLRKLSKLTKYGYSATGWKDLLLFVDGESIKYDDLGNPIIYRGSQLKWNYLRNLEKIGDIATYKYNASGIRTSKIVGGTETKFYLNGNKIIAQDDETNRILFYYGIDGLAGFSINGVEYTYKKNIQNDIIGIYDADGNQIVKYVYDAWGNHKTFVLYNGKFVDISLENDYNDDNYQGKVEIAELNPFRYRSYYLDEETGLYYLNSRYYDAELGRFINADSLEILENTKEIINGLNLFAYCLNNPVNTSDDNGEMPNWLKWLIGGIIVLVAVVTIVVTGGAASGFVGAIIVGAAKGALIGAGIGLATGTISGAITGDWSGLADSFMWGAISGLVSGGISGGFGYAASNNIKLVGDIIGKSGKLLGNKINIGLQIATSVGTYIGETLTSDNEFSVAGFAFAILGGVAGGTYFKDLASPRVINIINSLQDIIRDIRKRYFPSKLFNWLI